MTTTDEIRFTRGPARRPQPQALDPVLQWSSGLPTAQRALYAGWLSEVGRARALDEAMHEAKVPQVQIKHGSGQVVRHWALETADLYVIADGVQTISEMQTTGDRYGIAFAWRTLRGGRQQSQIRFRVVVGALAAVGYTEPLLVTAKGTLTGDIIAALMQQYAVLDAVDAFRRQQGKPEMQPPFYACSIPLGPGRDVTRGSGEATKEITPVVAAIPQPVTRDYILAHWATRPVVARVEGLMEATIAWSVATSVQIAAGEERAAGAGEDAPCPQ
ncbi:hypothetical protein F8S13_22100 [Chloroflexia bacterium SDU3-3]|nr:hypothetical protein F8S13_22100 [Chloroflexia bacterium SDU3-3]